MTPVEAIPLVLWGVPLLVLGGLAAREVCVEFQRRSWNRRAERLIASMEERHARNVAQRILEDAEVAFLDACWEMPPAPGSWK